MKYYKVTNVLVNGEPKSVLMTIDYMVQFFNCSKSTVFRIIKKGFYNHPDYKACKIEEYDYKLKPYIILEGE